MRAFFASLVRNLLSITGRIVEMATGLVAADRPE